MRKRYAIIAFMVIFLGGSLLLTAHAISPFNMPCPSCQSAGSVTSIETCPMCNGSGEATNVQNCSRCSGSGKATPRISRKSMDAWETFLGPLRVRGVFRNEENEGTYVVVTSEVHALQILKKTFYHSSAKTYFPPREDVTITIDTFEIQTALIHGEHWMADIYVSSSDNITCPECNGTGKIVTTICSQCSGAGSIHITKTCLTCEGRAFLPNWTNLCLIALLTCICAILIAGTALFQSKPE